jgi:hypothetical protein
MLKWEERKVLGLDKKMDDTFGELVAEKIKSSMIEEYRHRKLSETSRRGTTFGAPTVNLELEVMRRIFNLAIREEMVSSKHR